MALEKMYTTVTIMSFVQPEFLATRDKNTTEEMTRAAKGLHFT